MQSGKEKHVNHLGKTAYAMNSTDVDIIKQDILEVMNQIYMTGSVTDVQKIGAIVCIPKKPDPGGLEVAHYGMQILNSRRE